MGRGRETPRVCFRIASECVLWGTEMGWCGRGGEEGVAEGDVGLEMEGGVEGLDSVEIAGEEGGGAGVGGG